jgi:integrase
MSKITDETAKRLKKKKIASGNYVEWDPELKGFGIRVTAGGVVAFILSYRSHGVKRRYTIGRYGDDEWSAKAARAEAGKLKIGIDAGIDPLAERRKKRAEPEPVTGEKTFKDLVDKYLEWAGLNKKPRSIRDDKLKTNGILSRWNDRAITSITQDDVEELKRDLQATPYQANRTLALLSKMFNLASLKWKYRPDNPVRGVTRFEEHPRHIYLEREQVVSLIRALDQYHNQNAADVIRLLLLTGAREGEALRAEWSEFNLKLGVWNKPRRHMKNAEEHHLALNEDTLALLQKMKPQKKGPLFPAGARASEKHRVSIRKPWIQICKTAGLVTAVEKKGKRRHKVIRYKPHFHIHDLRHTFASWLVQNKVPLYDVSKLLGHAKVATTERFYAHHDDESLRKATNVFGGLFRDAVGQ